MIQHLKSIIKTLLRPTGLQLKVSRPRPIWPGDKDRFSYQRLHVPFRINSGDKVLDVGCGAYPFPLANVLVDLYLGISHHRSEPLKTDGKPLVVSDITALPFKDKEYDYVYCSHVLEHVESPVAACREIIRVGRRGYIETPSYASDLLFAWAKGMHKWSITAVRGILVFLEYSDRQLDGIRSDYWRKRVLGGEYDELQAVFYNNADVFHTMFVWEEAFQVFVFRASGAVETMNQQCVKFEEL